MSKRDELLAWLRDERSLEEDPEVAHIRATALLLDVLNDPEVTAAWEAADDYFWYA